MAAPARWVIDRNLLCELDRVGMSGRFYGALPSPSLRGRQTARTDDPIQ